MESARVLNLRLQGLFSNICDKNQNVTTIATRIKSFITQESQLMYGARFLFDKAETDPSLGAKCAELAKAIANVAVDVKGNSLQPITFRDCIVQLALDEMKDPIRESKKLSTAYFIIHLHKAGMLSTEFINYRIAYFNSFQQIRAVKFFIDKITSESAAKTLLARQLKVPNEVPQSNEKAIKRSETFTSFVHLLNQLESGLNATFDFNSLKLRNETTATQYAKLLFAKVKVQKNTARIKVYAEVIDKLNRSFPSHVAFIKLFVDLCITSLAAFKENSNGMSLNGVIGVGLMLSELYNFKMVKNVVLNLWFDNVQNLALMAFPHADEAMLSTFRICAFTMKERDLVKFNECVETVKTISLFDKTSPQDKKRAEEILQSFNIKAEKSSFEKRDSVVEMLAKVEADFNHKKPSCQIEHSDELLLDFQSHLDQLHEDSEFAFIFDDYETSETDISSCASTFVDTAMEHSDKLPLLINLAMEVTNTPYQLEFKRSLVSACKSRFKRQLDEQISTLSLVEVIGELYNAGLLPTMTVKFFLQMLSSPQCFESFQLLLTIISVKVRTFQDGIQPSILMSLKEIVDSNQANQTENIPKMDASQSFSSHSSEIESKSTEDHSEVPDESDVRKLLQALTPDNCNQIFLKVVDLDLLQECSGILLRKVTDCVEMTAPSARVLKKLIGPKPDHRTTQAIQKPFEKALDELFDDSDSLKLNMPMDRAINLISYSGELFRRTVFNFKFGFNCLARLHDAARQGNIENLNLLIAFMIKAVQRFSSITSFPASIFAFFTAQQSNEKLTAESREQLKKCIEMLRTSVAQTKKEEVSMTSSTDYHSAESDDETSYTDEESDGSTLSEEINLIINALDETLDDNGGKEEKQTSIDPPQGETIEELSRNGSLERLEMLILDLETCSIDELKHEAACIENLGREEVESFVSTFYDIAVHSQEPDLFVGLARMIFDETSSEDFKDALVSHVITETSELLNTETMLNNNDMKIGSSAMKLVGELYNIGWIKHACLMGCIEELTIDDFGKEIQFQFFHVLIKTVAFKIKESDEGKECIVLHNSLQSKMKSIKNAKFYFKAAEILKLLATH